MRHYLIAIIIVLCILFRPAEADASRVCFTGFESGFTSGSGDTLTDVGQQLQTVGTILSSVFGDIKRSGRLAFASITNGTDQAFVSTCMSQPTSGDWSSTTVASNLATMYTRVYIYIETSPTSYERVAKIINTSSSIKLGISIQTSGGGFVLRATDSAGTNYDNASILNTGEWYRLEIQSGTGTSTSFTVYVNGISWITSATANLTTVNNGGLVIGRDTGNASQTVKVRYDDVAVDNAALPGAGQVIMLYPNGAGASQTWTPSTGSDHAAVVNDWNEGSGDNGDTDYDSVSLSGTQAETEAVFDFVANFGSSNIIDGVLGVVVQRDASGNTNNGTARFRSGTTNSDSVAYDNTGSYQQRFRLFLTDPNTGSAWTPTALDSVECGFVKTQSQARAMRMTACGVMVDYHSNVGTPLRTLMGVGK